MREDSKAVQLLDELVDEAIRSGSLFLKDCSTDDDVVFAIKKHLRIDTEKCPILCSWLRIKTKMLRMMPNVTAASESQTSCYEAAKKVE